MSLLELIFFFVIFAFALIPLLLCLYLNKNVGGKIPKPPKSLKPKIK